MQAKVLKRIYKEIEDVNNDFFSLRTTITPDHDYYVQRFTFIMLPNDGPLAHLPLLGAFYIPDTYPESPPVVHLFTKTKRHCVDKFHHHAKRNMKSHSSLCFNILRSAEPDGHGSGTWTSECTLSALFAALMSAVVSFYVPREYGTDTAQPISMDGLRVIKDHVRKACEEHKEILPALMPRPPLVSAARVRANELCFPAEIVADADKTETVTAGPIYLQTGEKDDMYTFAVDLSEVHDKMVFSVILTNTLDDLTGRKPETVLVRNGVTATAARKRTGQEAQWFYHGKPMNDGDMRLHVTIGADQMTMAYYGDDGHRYILGDCPVSRLTHNEIGDVRGVPFWIQIYTKNRAKTPTKIYTLDTCGVGYLFRDAEDREFDFVDDPEQEEPLRRKSAAQETQGTEAGSGIAQETKD
ncbi:hypothetical protein CC79DRAFT_1337443 [Sarocladium strictum]